MKILVVDDDEINIELLQDYLTDDGFEVITASDGAIGWEMLNKNRDISVILLDKMMPHVNGLELLARIKVDPQFRDIPVIMQTAAADDESIIEGLKSGVYYYLTKPYKQTIMLSIVRAAINDSMHIRDLISEVRNSKGVLGLLKQAVFEYKTTDEAQNLAFFLAHSFPDPEKVILGLSEIMINAVEHGNLGIGYAEKGRLMINGGVTEEISRRARLPENIGKTVEIKFSKDGEKITVIVKDKGNGFDWRSFLEMNPDRAAAPNGRGVMMAKIMSFDSLYYNEAGNEAYCGISLKGKSIKVA